VEKHTKMRAARRTAGVGITKDDSRSIWGLEQHGKTRAAGEDRSSRGGQEQQRRTGAAEEDRSSRRGQEQQRRTGAAEEDRRSRGGQEKQRRTGAAEEDRRSRPGRKQSCLKQSNCQRLRNKKTEVFTFWWWEWEERGVFYRRQEVVYGLCLLEGLLTCGKIAVVQRILFLLSL
jgi:hypothetical protein